MDTPADSGVEQAQMPIKGGNRHVASFVAVVSGSNCSWCGHYERAPAPGRSIAESVRRAIRTCFDSPESRSIQSSARFGCQRPRGQCSVRLLDGSDGGRGAGCGSCEGGGATPTEYFEIAYAFANQLTGRTLSQWKGRR